MGEALAAAEAPVVAEALVAGVAGLMRMMGMPPLTAPLRAGCSDGSAGMRSRGAASTPACTWGIGPWGAAHTETIKQSN